MSLRLHHEAQDEVDAAGRWYEGRRPGLGADFLDEVGQVFQRIDAQPQFFPPISRPSGGREVRQGVVARFPYVVIYEVLGADVVVLAVSHTSRRPYYWSRRKP